jgi:hypothetical protein
MPLGAHERSLFAAAARYHRGSPTTVPARAAPSGHQHQRLASIRPGAFHASKALPVDGRNLHRWHEKRARLSNPAWPFSMSTGAAGTLRAGATNFCHRSTSDHTAHTRTGYLSRRGQIIDDNSAGESRAEDRSLAIPLQLGSAWVVADHVKFTRADDEPNSADEVNLHNMPRTNTSMCSSCCGCPSTV